MGRPLTLDIQTNDAQTRQALARLRKELGQVDSSLDKTAQRGLSLGGALGGLAIGAGIGLAVSEFEEAEKGMRATEAVIKSTGNAAEVSAEQQAKLVDELSRLAGIDDDVVNGGANMLRTFTEIKGENFGLALASALDIAAMKGQDFATVSEQVGKALNDPVAGMGKLAKQGVVLSEVQKQQVRDFAAVGDVASAQKVILDELEKEYGGQAEAASTASGRMKVAFGEAAESVGGVLAPALEVGADAAGAASAAFGNLAPEVQGVALVAGAGVAAWARWGDQISAAGGTAKDTIGKVRGFGASVSDLASTNNYTRPKAALESLKSSLGNVSTGAVVGTTGLTSLAAALVYMQVEADRTKQNMKDLQESIGSGMSESDAVAEKLANTLAGVDGGFAGLAGSSDQFREKLHDLGLSATEAVELITAPAEEWEKTADRILNGDGNKHQNSEFIQNINLMRDAIADGAKADQVLTDVRAELKVGTEEVGDATEDAAGKIRDAADATTTWYGVEKEQVDAWSDRLDVLTELNDEMQESIDLAYESVDAALAEKSAHDQVQDAQKALAETRRDGSAEEQQRAADDLTAAILREVEAADKSARKTAEMAGEQYDAADSAAVQRARLNELAEQTGFTSDEMKWLGALLDNAAKERDIKLYTAASEERLTRLKKLMEEIHELSTTIGIGGSVLSGTAGAAIQQSDAYNRDRQPQNSRTPAARGGGVTIVAPNLRNVTPQQVEAAARDASRRKGRRLRAVS